MTERGPWGHALGVPRPNWSESEVSVLRLMVDGGASDQAISDLLGRSARGVAIKRSRLDLTIRSLDRNSIREYSDSYLRRECVRRGWKVSR